MENENEPVMFAMTGGSIPTRHLQIMRRNHAIMLKRFYENGAGSRCNITTVIFQIDPTLIEDARLCQS